MVSAKTERMLFMGLIFVITAAAAEIALITVTFSRFREKAAWLKNRTLTTAVETIMLLGIILLPTTYLKWRFALATVVLFVRLIFEAIRYAAARKKASGEKNKAAAIVSGVLAIVFVALTLVPAFVFKNYNGLETTGPLTVASSSAILVDKSRLDSFENDGSNREVPVHFFYPEEKGEYPLVLFSHGAFGYYQSNYSTYTELASSGYVVAALDHPHHAFFTTDTSGNTVIVDSTFFNDAMTIGSSSDISEDEIFKITQAWMEIRTADENFVIDTIESTKTSSTLGEEWYTDDESEILSVISKTDVDKIGLMGHSMGGATSVALGRERSDIDAVIDMDGTMLTERVSVNNRKYQYISEPYPVPILDFTKEVDYNERKQFESENGYIYVNDHVIANAADGRTVVFGGAAHMDFTDLPLISPILSSMLDGGESSVDNEEFMTTVNGIVLGWFNHYLKGEGLPEIRDHY